MSKNEKKAIDMLEKYITEHKLYNIKQSDGLEDNIKILLDLYKQEKEKNKELKEELQKYISGEYFTEKQAKHLEMTRKMFWINKDKIREHIKLLEDMKQTGRFKQIPEDYFKGAIEQLKELLEEE